MTQEQYIQQFDYLNKVGTDCSVLAYWRPTIEKIMKRAATLHSFNEIVEHIIRGSKHLFHSEDAFIIFQPDQRANGIVLHVYAAGGKSKQALLKLSKEFEGIARAMGAKQLTAVGRVGFETWPEAWESTGHVLFVKEL